MALVNITNVVVENNPAPFLSQLKFNITFQCLKGIEDAVEWKLIYIGSAKDQCYDQIIDSFDMGPLNSGVMQFTIESNPPDYTKILKEDLLDVTAIVISVVYRKQEFFRLGYYIHNEYADPVLAENPPEEFQIDKIVRRILADKPRITRMAITWDDTTTTNENSFGVSNVTGAQNELDNTKPAKQPQTETYNYGMFTNGAPNEQTAPQSM